MDSITHTLDGPSQLSPIAIEQAIATIWQNELDVDAVAADADFFALGGDSLKMLTVLFRIGQMMGVEVTPEVLYVHPTLREFSKAVEELRTGNAAAQGMETGTI